MTIDDYDKLSSILRANGLHVAGVQTCGYWQRMVICSKRTRDGRLTGNSFWVSHLPWGWYLGTWAICIYRLPEQERIAALCLDWLSREADEVRPDFDARVQGEFKLIPVTDDDFTRLCHTKPAD